jgi:hypothetical protein
LYERKYIDEYLPEAINSSAAADGGAASDSDEEEADEEEEAQAEADKVEAEAEAEAEVEESSTSKFLESKSRAEEAAGLPRFFNKAFFDGEGGQEGDEA